MSLFHRRRIVKLRVANNRVEWDGSHLNFDVPVLEAIRLEDRIVVIHDYMAYPLGLPAPNLVAYSLNGERLWTADNLGGTSPTDAYVGFMEEEPLIVWNYDCFRCTIDPQTGKLLNSEFTK